MDLSSIFRFSDMVEYFPKILSRFPVTLLIVVVSVAGTIGNLIAQLALQGGWSWDLFWQRHVSLKYQC